jgi:hypothetical protein
MIRKYNINGTTYEYDIERPMVLDAMMLKTATKMNMVPFTQALNDADPVCFTALAWLLLTKAGVKGPAGEPIKLAEVPDFDMLEFLNYDQDGEEPDDETDPPTGPSSTNGTTADSTPPEPSPTTG